jgi:hypothetical protein
MKKFFALLAGLMLVSSLGFAGADPDDDSFGFFFDTDGFIYEAFTAAPFQPVTGYLVVSNPTSVGVSGWECKIVTSGTPVAPSWTYAGGGLNVYDANATGLFNVGVGPGPLALTPVNGVVVLASWTGYILAPTDVVTFTILPFPSSVTFDNAPGYVDGDDVGIVVPCGVSTGFPYGPFCASINLDPSGIVADEEVSWGAVKTLFD